MIQGVNSGVTPCVPIVTLAVDNSPARLCPLCDLSSVGDLLLYLLVRTIRTSNGILRGCVAEENTTKLRCREDDAYQKIFATHHVATSNSAGRVRSDILSVRFPTKELEMSIRMHYW